MNAEQKLIVLKTIDYKIDILSQVTAGVKANQACVKKGLVNAEEKLAEIKVLMEGLEKEGDE